MSNYTNRELYFKNKHLLPRVGLHDDATHNERYVKQQTDLINASKGLLPPHIEYSGTNFSEQKQDPNFRSMPPGSRLKTHEPLDRERYDPYVGFLHEKGLLEDSGVLRYNTHYININSANRNLLPIPKISESFDLVDNALDFDNGSNVMTILHADHPFQINDRITLTGSSTPVITLRNKATLTSGDVVGFELTTGSDLMKLYYTHDVPSTYTGTSVLVQTDGINGNTSSTATVNSYFDNIPVNLLNKTHVYLPADTAANTVYDPNDGGAIFDPNSFYVRLDKTYTGTFDVSLLTEYNFTIKFTTIAGVPLNEINAEYPIDIAHLNGFHTIKSTSDQGYTVELTCNAAYDLTGTGGLNMQVGQIEEILDAYPNPNHYIMRLGNTFHNIISGRLISSEFPNTRMAIRDFNDESKNNLVHWNNFDDGDYLYSIEIEPGNYTPTELIAEMEAKFTAVERVNFEIDNATGNTTSTPPYSNKNIIQVEIDTSTNIVTFKSLREAVLSRPITATIPAITGATDTTTFDSEITLILTHSNHGLVVGDEIIISGSIAHFGIPTTSIDGTHIITEVDDENTYRIILPKFNLSSGGTDTGGGIALTIFSPNTFRLRMDQENSIGELLGFRNVGDSTSIHEYATSITNQTQYEFEKTTNALGETVEIRQNFLKLSGDDYFLMTTDKLFNLTSSGPIKEVFAKIILCDIPGKTLYNSFVHGHVIRKRQLPQLSELEFRFYAPDGTLFDFQNIDHSFTLELTTIQELPKGSNVSGKTGRINFQGVTE